MLARTHQPVSISIESSCHETFELISSLVENHVVNKELAFSEKNQFSQDYNNWEKRWNGLKPSVARAWLALFVFSMLIMREATKEEESNYMAPIIISAFIGCMLKYYQHYFGSMPFEYIGTKLLLNKADNELCDNQRKHNFTYLQAERMSPYNSLRLFSTNPLDKALQSGKIGYFEHNAIMRGLFGLKNKAFDCVNISALVMLMLIEKQIPTSIMRIRPAHSSMYGHHYVLVNLSPDCKLRDINTWNDDAMLIDPWYGVCASAKEIKNDKDFFNRYPLLHPSDKVISANIQGNIVSPAYQFAINLFKQLREEYAIQPNNSPSHINMVYPRLPVPIQN